jgi:hypothetical protein
MKLFQETWYLKKYLDEIELEKHQRSMTTPFTTAFAIKDENGVGHH